jgi:hypothetical protein
MKAADERVIVPERYPVLRIGSVLDRAPGGCLRAWLDCRDERRNERAVAAAFPFGYYLAERLHRPAVTEAEQDSRCTVQSRTAWCSGR